MTTHVSFPRMDQFSDRLMALLPACPPEITVENLLRLLVASECQANDFRQAQRRTVLVWSQDDIQQQLKAGRAGVSDTPNSAPTSIDVAVTVALTSFRDGLVLLFVDETRRTQLDETLQVTAETKLTLIRRMMLQG